MKSPFTKKGFDQLCYTYLTEFSELLKELRQIVCINLQKDYLIVEKNKLPSNIY